MWVEAITLGKPIISKLIDNQLHFYYVMLAHLTALELRQANGVVDKSNIYLWYNQTDWGAKIVQLMKKFGGFRFIP